MYQTNSIATSTLEGFLPSGTPRSKQASKLTIPAVLVFLLSTTALQAESSRSLSVLYTFTGGVDGQAPAAALIQDNAGNLYGTTTTSGTQNCTQLGVCGTVFEVSTKGGFESTLYDFTGASGNGPAGGVVEDAAGNFYGATSTGGTGDGVVYKLSTSGVETILYAFSRANYKNGVEPLGGLVMDAAGNLYGTTGYGGLAADCCGVVFKIDATGVYSVLYTFQGAPNGGATPQGDLVIDAAGNLFGVTTYGGGNTTTSSGTLFKIDPTGKETTLFVFECGAGGAGSGCLDGAFPQSGLIEDGAGNLYGVTPGSFGILEGTVYKLTQAGSFITLYSFTGGADGGSPNGRLVRNAKTGDIYGTAGTGGNGSSACGAQPNFGCGVIFKVNPSSGTETVLYSFTGLDDGFAPVSGLIARTPASGAKAFELFGTTSNGGSATLCPGIDETFGCGTVFKLAVTP